jgi:tetratricopeptide (TPR) repeat protein
MNKPLTHLLLIAVLGLLIYSNTFHSPFQWDEADFILGNPIIRNLNYFTDTSRAEGLPVYDGLKSRYIGYLTFALNYKLHGFEVLGYHIVNIAIHLINAILVYFLVLLTFHTPFFLPPHPPLAKGGTEEGSLFTIHFSRFFALAVSLLFVAHPLQTEAVTYIFQRLASLVSMFYLLSLVLYIKGRQIQVEAKVKVEKDSNSTLRPYSSASALTCFILSFLSAVLAMKTKENAFTLPVIITLYEFLFFSGPVKTRLLRLAPFLLTMLIVPLTIMGTGSTPGEIISQVKDPASMGFITPTPQDYLFTQFRVIVTYLRLLFWPSGQTLLYNYPIYQSFFTPPVLFSFLFLASLFGAAVYLVYKSQSAERREHSEKDNGQSAESSSPMPYAQCAMRLVAFGILWFFITLSVESSIIPIPMVINEYRAYLPSVGFFIAIMSGVMLFFQRFFIKNTTTASPLRGGDKGEGDLRITDHGSRIKVFAVALFALIILALASATYARNNLWKDKVSLWQDVVSKSPDFPLGYNNLGLVYEELGEREKAILQFRKAAQIDPNYATTYINLGYTLAAMGWLDEAIGEYQTALRLEPDNWRAHLNLGQAYGQKGLAGQAIEELQAALKANPKSAAAFNNLGNVYRLKGEVDNAIGNYLTALQLEPDFAEAHYNLGGAYEQKGEAGHAIEHYLAALRTRPDYVGAHYNLGRVYVQVKRLDDAIEQLEAVVRLVPESSIYHNTLGVLYGQKGLYDEAIKQFEAALRLAPDTEAYRHNLERARGLKSKKES